MDVSSHEIVLVDIEVAGTAATSPIIQVAAVAVTSNLEELETFEAKLKFDRRRGNRRFLTKNRYCPKTWATQARPARAVARDFARFLRRHATVELTAADGSAYRVAQLVAHNAGFDGPLLQAWFERSGAFFPGHYRMLCTLQRAQWLFHEHPHLTPPRDFKLSTLCHYFGVPLHADDVHNALADVRATAELYRRMSLLATAKRAELACDACSPTDESTNRSAAEVS